MRSKIQTASNSAPPYTGGISIKSSQELELMRRAGRIMGVTLAALRKAVVPGVATQELDAVALREMRRLGGKPTFKGYRGFPAAICASINEEIVHGIPGDRVVREGDLVKLDVGVTLDGMIADAAITVAAGVPSSRAAELVEVTRRALEEAIQACRKGKHVGDIGAAIQGYVEPRGFSAVREYVGHGVGRYLHEEPQIPNYGQPGMGPALLPGMTIAIEPMVNAGGWKTALKGDQWTVVTADGALSAHFEHTVLITDGEPEVLTREAE
ncbi:MAG: type I methionyl aminopeptidase [Chloroflexota bacterium]|nr:type I methionyl aminopeptidase [Chloroflexota bacterium]